METNPFRAYRDGFGPERDGAASPRSVGGAGVGAFGEASSPAAAGGSLLARVTAWVGARVEGRRWWVRAPLLLVLMWVAHRLLEDPTHASLFSGINLGFHEMGHAAFMAFGGSRILVTAGGTIFEMSIPLIAAGYLLFKQHDPFGAAVCMFWCGTALVGIGVYAADARAQALPLVSPFGPIDVDSHDWTVMLMRYGMLTQDERIGAAFQRAGFLAMALGFAASVWVLRVMAVRGRAATEAAAGG